MTWYPAMANQAVTSPDRGPALMNSFMNGDSYDFISPTSSTRRNFNMSGVGQMSLTDVSLEQALERVQELKNENNELRGVFYKWKRN